MHFSCSNILFYNDIHEYFTQACAMNIVVVRVISSRGCDPDIIACAKMAVEFEEDGTLLMNGQRVLQEDYDENYEPTYEGMHVRSCRC